MGVFRRHEPAKELNTTLGGFVVRTDADDEGGRGLALVSNLSERWGTSRKAVGKVVWFELPFPHDERPGCDERPGDAS